MGYRVEYHTVQKKHNSLICFVRLPVLIVLCFFFFLFLVDALWPDGAAFIQKSTFFPTRAVAVSTLDALADELHSGEGLITAISDFCKKLIP